ncbi:MAG: response regulator, partial [Candidatus Paceibacterota bacterium]
ISNGMKVLLVDDDAFLRDMYATKFMEFGHEVEGATDAKTAFGKIKEGNYDAVLLDVIMPSQSGLELLKEINDSGLKKNSKYIILSNQSESSDRAMAGKLGADGYIVKAESIPSDVVKKVEEICKK